MKPIINALGVIFAITFIISCNSTEEEVCTPVFCYNGGTSNEFCACECPPGFIGESCSDQDTPTSITIKKVTIKSFPALDTSGSTWDFDLLSAINRNPDIFYAIIRNEEVIYVSPYHENAATDGTYFIFEPNFQINNIENQKDICTINLYDYDSGEYEYMDFALFDLYDKDNLFPKEINSYWPLRDLQATLELSYSWN